MSDVTFPKCSNCGGDLIKPVGEINDETEIICSGCSSKWSYRQVIEQMKQAVISELQKGLKGLKINL